MYIRAMGVTMQQGCDARLGKRLIHRTGIYVRYFIDGFSLMGLALFAQATSHLHATLQ